MFNFQALIAKPMVKYVLLPLLVAAGAAFYKWAPWIQQDNPVEEHIEVILYTHTGEDIDLSPSSEEPT